MNEILKKQLIAGILDLIICSIAGIMVYFTSGLIEIFNFLNILNVIGFIYLIYTIIGFLFAGRSPGDSLQGIILIKAKTGKYSRFSFFFKEMIKILLIFYISLLKLDDFNIETGIIIFVFLMLLYPVKYSDENYKYFSILNFVSKTIYKDILVK